jgi:hypothetical protein
MSQQVNFFDPAFLKHRKYFSARAMLQALCLIVIGAAVFYGYARYQIDLLDRQFTETTKRYSAEQQRYARFSQDFSPKETSASLQEELNKLQFEAAAQQEILNALKSGVIGNTEGYSEYMRAFARQTLNGLWLTGFLIEGDGAQMSLYGAALTPQLVPVYIQRLGKEKSMRGKHFSSLQIQQPKLENNQAQSYLEFSMQSAEARGEEK